MNPPDFISEEQLAVWEESRPQDNPKLDPGAVLMLATMGLQPKSDEFHKQMYYAGCWLGGVVADDGADENVESMVCQAFGQKAFFSDDPWKVAQECLDQYRTGNWDRPGLELADRLCKENLKR